VDLSTAGEPEGTVYVLVPVHNRRPVTEAFARSLAAQTDSNVRLVLIDDGSTDGTADAVKAILPDTVVITGQGNWWWGGGLQQGYLWLKRQPLKPNDIVLTTNDDVFIEPDFVALGRQALAARPRSLVLAQLYSEDGQFEELGVFVDWKNLHFTGVVDPARVNCFSTRGLIMRASDFLMVGGFHPHLLPHYLSDYEFTMRAHRKGLALASDPSFRLRYDAKTTGTKQEPTDSLRNYLRTCFSKRTTLNPVYSTTVLLLACPRRYLPRNVFRVWRIFARGCLRAIR
jgi:GT2 family glycosyltransferase